MIFQHTHEWIFAPSPHTGELKTQTRRIVKPGQVGLPSLPDYETGISDGFGSVMVYEPRKRHIWGTGLEYAVQPGRGQRAIGRIRITAIRREDVRQISAEDARAEGFDSRVNFFEAWVSMHDRNMEFYCEAQPTAFDGGCYRYWAGRKDNWQSTELDGLIELINERPAKRYDAWVLTFEPVPS